MARPQLKGWRKAWWRTKQVLRRTKYLFISARWWHALGVGVPRFGGRVKLKKPAAAEAEKAVGEWTAAEAQAARERAQADAAIRLDAIRHFGRTLSGGRTGGGPLVDLAPSKHPVPEPTRLEDFMRRREAMRTITGSRTGREMPREIHSTTVETGAGSTPGAVPRGRKVEDIPEDPRERLVEEQLRKWRAGQERKKPGKP